MHPLAAALTAALASGLEFVEAATIVLAVGHSAGWRIALRATAGAIAVLLVICAIFGPALVKYVPLQTLKIAIGTFLLLFGYTWLRKAIWRYAGRKAMRDEQQTFERELGRLSAAQQNAAFAAAFNGVFIEGLEVAVIILTFAAASVQTMLWAAAGALASGAVVTLAVAILRHPLRRVPETAMAFLVGVMLLTFGTFWSGEGFRIEWPLGDVAIIYLAVAYAVSALVLIALRRAPAPI